MPRRALLLLAGTTIAIAPCGAATSQVLNQVQLGDVFSTQSLNVETVTETTEASTTATANQASLGADGVDMDVRSYQESGGRVGADTRMSVGYSSGQTTDLYTGAAGNMGEAAVIGGTMTGVITQTVSPSEITAYSYTSARNGRTDNVASVSQAAGNDQALGVSAGAAGVRVNQHNEGEIFAGGGGEYAYVPGVADFQGDAAGNRTTLNGDGGSAERIIASQNNAAGSVEASQYTAFGSVQDGTTRTTAAGNSLNAYNEGYLLDTTATQLNNAYVRSEAKSQAVLYGAGQSTADAVGNMLLAGDVGGELVLDATQTNSGGGVEAIADFTGEDGYDAHVAATATGNSATGYACADCQGVISVNSNQTNDADVAANASSSVAVSGRSVTGVSKAVGNSATYYVTRPGQ